MIQKNDHVVHEGVIRDIVDIISDNGMDLSDFDLPFSDIFSGQRYMSGITKATSKLILTFPVICDESVSLETARIVTKSVERKVVAMLQILFSAVNINNNADAFDFVGKVHQNLTSDDILTFINKMDAKPFKESVDEVREVQINIDKLNEAYEKYLNAPEHFLIDDLKPALEDVFTVDPNTKVVHEMNKGAKKWYRDKYGKDPANHVMLRHAEIRTQNRINGPKHGKLYNDTDFIDNPKARTGPIYDINERRKKLNELNNGYYMNSFKPSNKRKGKNGFNKFSNKADRIQAQVSKRDAMNKAAAKAKNTYNDDGAEIYEGNNSSRPFVGAQMLDADIKKANEEMPSLMQIYFRSGEDNMTEGYAVIGVKAKLVYVTQDDMIDRIILKDSDQNTFFSIIRATTGEISMIKDLLFAVDRAKLDIFSRKKNTSSPVWKLLERRAIVSRGNRALNRSNGAGSAIATLLISSDTEDRLQKEYNFKCNPFKLLNIMHDYSVMGFIIVDDVNEKAKYFWDDNSTQFETLSYASLEREDKGQYKKIINLLAGK